MDIQELRKRLNALGLTIFAAMDLGDLSVVEHMFRHLYGQLAAKKRLVQSTQGPEQVSIQQDIDRIVPVASTLANMIRARRPSAQ